MSISILRASKHGSTAEIAARIGEALSAQGLEVAVDDLENAHLAKAQQVVIGIPIYTQKLMASGAEFLAKHREQLGSKDVFIFVSGGSPHLDGKLQASLEQYTSHDVQYFRGSVDSTKLNVAEKAILKLVKSPLDADWRDWEAIDQWAETIATSHPGTAGS